MSKAKSEISNSLGFPPLPDIARDFLNLDESQSDLQPNVENIVERYPQFFDHLLKIINSEHYNQSIKVNSVFQSIQLSGLEKVTGLVMIQIVYRAFNQYKIVGLDMPEFWQDSLRRGVSARMIGELIGLDPSVCFIAGFVQDLGFFLQFLEQPEKGGVWGEFRKREPQARLSMEHNVFNSRHDRRLAEFLQSWNIFPQIQHELSSHHNTRQCLIEKSTQPDLHHQLCCVLHCADWMSAVYTADDKSYVINRCRKLLTDNFQLEAYRTEQLLQAIPDEVDLSALLLGIKVNKHTAFSQILYEANIRLNEDNVYFQELTMRLEQALSERDRLAAELNRDLNLAREIQKSLLPDEQEEGFPVSGINISAKVLSGDFYDYFELENGDVYFNLGDVSGKGVNAALLMAKTSSLFRCLGKRIADPGQLLYEINNELCETSIHGKFVTMVAGLYCPSTDELTLVNAGNPPALLFLDTGICQEFEASAPPLGVMPDTIYSKYSFKLSTSRLYIYSDGVTEGYCKDNTMLALSGLFKLISNLDNNLAPKQRLSSIVEHISQSAKPLRDDATLLLLENTKS